MDEKRVVNVEKRAVNKPGLILLLIIVLGGLGYGGYYFYNNRDYYSISFTFPWEKENTTDTNKKGEKIDKKTGFRLPREDKIDRSSLAIDKDEEGNSLSYYDSMAGKISLQSIDYDKDKGFTLNLNIDNGSDLLSKVKVNNISLDKYQTNLTFEKLVGGYASDNASVLIPKDLLDLYRISSFSEVILYAELTRGEEVRNEIISLPVLGMSTDKNIKPVEQIANSRDVYYHYYKVVEENDRYYLYLMIDNKGLFDVTYYVNKLMINGKEYKGTIEGKKVYSKSAIIDKIEILKNDHKNIKTITISFFAKSEGNNIYQTSEKEVEL